MDPKDVKLTQGDLAAHVDRVVKALGGSDVAGLVRRLSVLEREAVKPDGRMPFAIVGDPPIDGRGASISLEPTIPCEVGHLVLSDESSKTWELSSMVVNRTYLSPGEDRSKPFQCLPLETFSIRYMQDDRFGAVHRFKSERVYPGSKIHLTFQLKEGAAPCQLRGVLWVETFA